MRLCTSLATGMVWIEGLAAAPQRSLPEGMGIRPGAALGEAARRAARVNARTAVLDGVDGLPLGVEGTAGHAAALKGEILVEVVLGDVVVRGAVAPVSLPVGTLAAPVGIQRGDPAVPGGVLLPAECGPGGKHILSPRRAPAPAATEGRYGTLLFRGIGQKRTQWKDCSQLLMDTTNSCVHCTSRINTIGP